jgi:nitroreductase
VEAYDAIVSKRDTRRYSRRPIPEDALQRILQAGRMAGSAKNAQPLRFIVLQSPESKDAIAKCGQWATHVVEAPVAIAIVLLPEGDEPGAPFTLFRGPFDAGRAAQNMMVAAWSLGITSCPASMHDAEAASDALGLPEGHIVANVIAFGYPEEGQPLHGGRQRLPLADVVHWERW